MMRPGITIHGQNYATVSEHNQGYDVMMLMRDWDEDNWHWWAYQIKRIGLQSKIAAALAKWDDDNSTGVVNRAQER